MSCNKTASINVLDEEGYIHLGRIMDDGDLAGFRWALQRLPKRDRDTGTLFFTQKRMEIPALAAFAANGRHVEALSAYYCPNLRCYFDQFVVKPPITPNGVFPWHQDAGYSDDTTTVHYPDAHHQYRVTVWIALDDITAQNGGIWIVPRSHRNGRIAHENKTSWYNELTVREADALEIRLREGEAVAFTEYTVHRSLGNKTNRPRRSLFLAYCDADGCYPNSRPLNDGVPGNPYFPSGSAPLVAGTSRFP